MYADRYFKLELNSIYYSSLYTDNSDFATIPCCDRAGHIVTTMTVTVTYTDTDTVTDTVTSTTQL